jgi:hypothetical protein
MNHSEERLSGAFKDLAAQGPQGAPAELRGQLTESLRKRHLFRTRMRAIASACAVAACLGVITWLSLKGNNLFLKQSSNPPLASVPESTGPPALTNSDGLPDSGNGLAITKPEPPQRVLAAHRPGHRGSNRSTNTCLGPGIAAGFTPLPTYDPAFPADGYQIVRVGLQDAALSQLGLPIHESASGQRVVADLLLDRDGLPLAVRFLGRQKTQ